MNCPLRSLVWTLALFTAWEGLGGRTMGQPAAPVMPVAAGPTNLPPIPAFRPPTEMFRGLLRMTDAERARVFSNQQPEIRGRLEAKIQEYQAMTTAAREARLHATELHEYLEHFVGGPATNRPEQVASVPAEYRREVTDRLTQFDLLPPGLREQVLSLPATAGYFIGPPVPRPRAAPLPPPPLPPDPTRALRSLSPGERAQMFASFEDFFAMDKAAQVNVMEAVPANERSKVFNTVQQIGRLPKEQREKSLRVLGALVDMTDAQRQLFFNSAARWNAMTPAERDTWLKVVKLLPPTTPLPPAPTPPAARNHDALSSNN